MVAPRWTQQMALFQAAGLTGLSTSLDSDLDLLRVCSFTQTEDTPAVPERYCRCAGQGADTSRPVLFCLFVFCVPCVLEVKPRTSCMLGLHSARRATSLAPQVEHLKAKTPIGDTPFFPHHSPKQVTWSIWSSEHLVQSIRVATCPLETIFDNLWPVTSLMSYCPFENAMGILFDDSSVIGTEHSC